MAGTFTQIYIHAVWHVKGRNKLSSAWRRELFEYMAGIIRRKGQKPYIVNGVYNHVHMLFSINPSIAVSDLLRDVKCNSTKFLKEQGLVSSRFAWQTGFGAFSLSKRDVDRIYKYILNQESHHQRVSFKEEYLKLLIEFEIDFNALYLFDDLDDD
jgi:putative transposase